MPSTLAKMVGCGWERMTSTYPAFPAFGSPVRNPHGGVLSVISSTAPVPAAQFVNSVLLLKPFSTSAFCAALFKTGQFTAP